MIRNDEGLTKTYNRFHDPYENTTDIAELRGLHAAMDRAVLDAYGWTDIPTNCEFLLDYEVEEDDSGGGGGGSQKEEEAVPLSVARRGSRRGAGAALGTQRGPRRRRSRSRCGRKVVRGDGGKVTSGQDNSNLTLAFPGKEGASDVG